MTVSGDLDPLSTGVVYCELVCALQGLAQYDLAESGPRQWSGGARRMPVEPPGAGCTSVEILRLRSSCDEAESQALVACDELRPYLGASSAGR